MKYNRLLKYTGSILLIAFVLAGCGSGQQTQADPEEHFNALIDESQDTYHDEVTNDSEVSGNDGSEDNAGLNSGETEEPSKESDDAVEVGLLNADNGCMEEIAVGTTCRVDLNNDGRQDTITYNVVYSDIAEYGTKVETFTINDGDYKYTLYLSDQGIHIQDPDMDRYYITDINTRDSYKEIAILDHGANGIPLTYFIRFVGSGTYCLGYVPYFPDDENFKIKGDGSIESAYDLTLLTNWQAPAVWLSGSDQMLSSNLSMRTPDLFYPYEDQSPEAVTQLKDLKLYPQRDLKSTPVEAKAGDSPVSFTQTDNKHWVYIKREDGVEGWIYMEDKDTIVSGSSKYNRRDVFKGL